MSNTTITITMIAYGCVFAFFCFVKMYAADKIANIFIFPVTHTPRLLLFAMLLTIGLMEDSFVLIS